MSKLDAEAVAREQAGQMVNGIVRARLSRAVDMERAAGNVLIASNNCV